jgi:hypothetical protein
MPISGFAHVVFAWLVISFVYGCGASSDIYEVESICLQRRELNFKGQQDFAVRPALGLLSRFAISRI